MHLTIFHIKSHEDKRDGILNALHSVKVKLKSNPDCTRCDVYFTSNNEQKILYMEQWQSKAALQAHIQSDLYRDILSIMEWAFETPDIHFYTIKEARGMEFITKTRQQT